MANEETREVPNPSGNTRDPNSKKRMLVYKDTMVAIANAVRAKTGKTGKIMINDLPKEIEKIGGGIVSVGRATMCYMANGGGTDLEIGGYADGIVFTCVKLENTAVVGFTPETSALAVTFMQGDSPVLYAGETVCLYPFDNDITAVKCYSVEFNDQYQVSSKEVVETDATIKTVDNLYWIEVTIPELPEGKSFVIGYSLALAVD